MPYYLNWVVPLWIVAVGAAATGALLWLFGAFVSQFAPTVRAVMRTTAKEARSQPLFPIVVALGLVLVLVSAFLPYGTMGDDIKMMKDTGLMMILVLSIILAVCFASVAIADEIDGRTALTVLSKPLTRRQFIIGKFLGVLQPLVVYYIVLGALFLCVTSFKVKFEARENALPPPSVAQCQAEILNTAPALVLAFLETVVMTAVSVAAGTRLAMLPNMLVCATIYVVGHMTPLIVQSSVGKLPIVAFIGQFLSTLLPVLEHFNVQAAIASGRDATLTALDWANYIGWAALYAGLYTAILLLLSLLMFEDRDLA